MLAYAACMREQGIAMPDPVVHTDGSVGMQFPEDVDKGAFAAADEVCRHLLAQAYPADTANPDAAREQDALLAYARCMREHGIQMDDPLGDGPGSVVVPAYVEGDPNVAANASFTAADDACKYLLPGKPGSSGSPGAGSSIGASGSAGAGAPAASPPLPDTTPVASGSGK